MSYYKHLNTFETADEYKVYMQSTLPGSPNIGYIKETGTTLYKLNATPGKEAIGSVYYSDGTFTLPTEDVDTTKTPIGVVVSTALESPLGDFKTRIISLLEPNAAGVGQSSNQQLKWSKSNIDTPLTNYSSADAAIAEKEDGKVNTATLVENYGADVPAAYACSLYSTAGTNAGDWYLPSAFELKNGYYENKSVIDATITKIKTACGSSAALPLSLGTNGYYWSSTEYSSYDAWGVNTYYGYVGGHGKYNGFYVRAFLAV